MWFRVNNPVIFRNFCKKLFLHFSGHPGNHKTLKGTKIRFNVSLKGNTEV